MRAIGPGAQPGDWRSAWDRARAVGPALAPGLWRHLRRERHSQGRLLSIGAFAAAAGQAADASLLDPAWMRRAGTADQLIVLLTVALGPQRAGAGDELRELVLDTKSEAVRIGGCLALARYATPTELPESWFAQGLREGPGIVAAALLAGAAPPRDLVRRWVADRENEAARLVLRAVLLSRWTRTLPTDEVLDLARGAWRRSDEEAYASRQAAAWRLGIEAERGVPKNRPVPQVLSAFAVEPSGQAAALARGWLVPEPSRLLDPRLRRVLAVQYALVAPASRLAGDAVSWRDELRLAGDVCLALAWRRLSRRDARDEEGLAAAAAVLRDVPEGAWLQVALGGTVAGFNATDDPLLDAALAQLTHQRLRRSDAAAALERALWRRDSHPGKVAHRLRAELVRDLLLTGSEYARVRLSRGPFAHLPADLKPGDRTVFQAAFEWCEWYAAAGDRIPDEARLR
ncbi:MAG: hypothetical protein AAF628_35035 [Planctomycetota bacterium]